MAKEKDEQFGLNSSVIDDGRGQNRSAIPPLTQNPPDPAGLIPQNQGKKEK